MFHYGYIQLLAVPYYACDISELFTVRFAAYFSEASIVILIYFAAVIPRVFSVLFVWIYAL